MRYKHDLSIPVVAPSQFFQHLKQLPPAHEDIHLLRRQLPLRDDRLITESEHPGVWT